jgi:nucleoside-diphosphate-sugar epimerase
MIKPRIIVTGATGRTGSVVASELLKAGYPVRAMVRRDFSETKEGAKGSNFAPFLHPVLSIRAVFSCAAFTI